VEVSRSPPGRCGGLLCSRRAGRASPSLCAVRAVLRSGWLATCCCWWWTGGALVVRLALLRPLASEVGPRPATLLRCVALPCACGGLASGDVALPSRLFAGSPHTTSPRRPHHTRGTRASPPFFSRLLPFTPPPSHFSPIFALLAFLHTSQCLLVLSLQIKCLLLLREQEILAC